MILNVGVVGTAPYIYPNWTNRTSRPGVLMELTQEMCAREKFSCNFSELPNEAKSNRNVMYDRMIEFIENGVFDTALPVFTATYNRSLMVDFSHTILSTPVTLITRTPSMSSGMSFDNLMGMDWSVWAGLMFSALVVGFLLTLTEKNVFLMTTKPFLHNTVFKCLDIFALITNHSQHLTPIRIGANVLLAFWAFSALVVSGVYSGNLMAALLKPVINYPFHDFNSFVNCLEKGQCQLVVNSISTSYVATYFDETIPAYSRIRKILKFVNPPIIKSSASDVAEIVLKTKDRYLVWITTEPVFISVTDGNPNCLYTGVRSGTFDRFHFPVNKRFKMKNFIQKFSMEVTQYGFYKKLRDKYIVGNPSCGKSDHTHERKPFPVASLFSLLFVLFVGIILSTIVFICEKLHFLQNYSRPTYLK